MLSTFFAIGWIPFLEIWYPKYSSSCLHSLLFSISHGRKNHTSMFYRPCHSAVFSYYLLLNTVCVSWMEPSEPLWSIDKRGPPYNIRLASAPAWHRTTRSQHWVCALTFLKKYDASWHTDVTVMSVQAYCLLVILPVWRSSSRNAFFKSGVGLWRSLKKLEP